MKLNYKMTIRLFALLTMGFYLSGCSMIKGLLPDDNNLDYKNTSKQKSLDVPPDLTKPTNNNTLAVPDLAIGANTYLAYQGKSTITANKQSALPSDLGIRFVHAGANSWLVLTGTKAQIWPRVREFWLRYGFVLVVDEEDQGILETEWAENRANVPKGTIRKLFGGLLDGIYSSGTRDKFRMRIETGEDTGTVELFLSHLGMVERVIGGDFSSEGFAWEASPTDSELEAKMLKRLMVDLGVKKQHADAIIAQGNSQQPNARILENGKQMSLQLDRGFSRSWRLIGLALDRISFTVVDRNRSKGVYYVRYRDPDSSSKKKGFFSKLVFWSSDSKIEERLYQVQLKSQAETVIVVINNEAGQVETSSTAERILKLLLEQLK